MIDILDDSYESDLAEEEHEELILMSEPTVGPPLSDSAQTILNVTIEQDYGYATPVLYRRLAAALRAVSHEVVPVPIKAKTPEEHWALLGVKNKLLAIADEFEAL